MTSFILINIHFFSFQGYRDAKNADFASLNAEIARLRTELHNANYYSSYREEQLTKQADKYYKVITNCEKKVKNVQNYK